MPWHFLFFFSLYAELRHEGGFQVSTLSMCKQSVKITPDEGDYFKWCQTAKIVPVSCEIDADTETPISLFNKFSTKNYCFLFESVEGGERWARYSIMGRNPLWTMQVEGGNTFIEEMGKKEVSRQNPIKLLDTMLEEFKGEAFSHLPRFYSGFVGYFGYDMVSYYEKISKQNQDEIGMPDAHLFIPEEVIVYDHFKQKMHIIINTFVPKSDTSEKKISIQRGYQKATEQLQNLREEILYPNGLRLREQDLEDASNKEKVGPFSGNFSKKQFCSAVDKAKKHIKDGDIFQVVLSQRLSAPFTGSPYQVYRKLRKVNPSPYMYYIVFDNATVVGASPEMLVRLQNDRVETCPIAGTRKRGLTEQEELSLVNELKEDEKECAEHMMLVDLGRNDVGKVSSFGSVEVKNLMHIEKFSHVMHMVTNVEGTLKTDSTPLDVLTAVLPAGTVSGAPKIRAMQIIEELEPVKRGVYAGAIGYIGFDGNMDTCIAIRTAVFKNGYAYVQAGAGIVADSVPENEYIETLNKAQGMINAIEKAGEL